MKNIITLFVFIVSVQVVKTSFGQATVMSNTTINQCFGSLLDPGGTSNYPNSNVTTTTICSGISGASVRLSFTFFNTQAIFDNLTIYDGNTTLSTVLGVYSGIQGPFEIQATNPTGCLTLVFSSDASNKSLGFNANISCAFPCQSVVNQVTSTAPISSGSFIDLCLGTVLVVNGNGSYTSASPLYPQSDATSTFRWDFGDLTSISLQNTSHQYANPGIYDLNLTIIDINGCKSVNDVNLRVRVSDVPRFNGTVAANNTICLGQTNELSGFSAPTEIAYFCESSDPEDIVIPDGIGVPYSTTLNLDCFNPAGTITALTDITSICFDVEHSNLHDLEIILTCPNGTSISLYGALAGATNSVHLGESVDNNLSTTLGTPYSYCFNMTALNTMYDVAEGISGPVPIYNYIDNDGTGVISAMYIPAGDYLPIQSFGNLIGCPLNGNWTLSIIDQVASNNGAIFDISLDFNSTLYSASNNYTPYIASSWLLDPTITVTTGNTITVTPISVGNKCYTYQAIDAFNCIYDTTICFDVFPSDDASFSYAQSVYCTNNPNPTPIITGISGGVFNASNGLPINPLTGTINLILALAGTYEISYLTPGSSCPTLSTTTIVINSTEANFSAVNFSGCEPLTTLFTNLSSSSVSCIWNFGDGNSFAGCGPISHIYVNEGYYSPQLTINDINGCQAVFVQTNLIQVDPQPFAEFLTNPIEIPIFNQTVILNNTSTGAINYIWIFADNTSSGANSPILNLNLNEDDEFLVKLYAFSSAGCIDSAQQYLQIVPELIFYVPNSFTPNNDEFNKSFLPIMSSGFISNSYNFRIYDKWGALLFHSKDINIGWDGTQFNTGKIVQDGIYTYQLDFLMNINNKRHTYNGNVNVIR
jgi:gliding motility-associated-like protein